MKSFKAMSCAFLALPLAGFLGLGCALRADGGEEDVLSLKESATPFVEAFNRLKGRPRFVTLLSPT